jgi:hypothetical protein
MAPYPHPEVLFGFATILPPNCLAPNSMWWYPQIRKLVLPLTGKYKIVSGGTGWHMVFQTFNQGVTGSRPVRPIQVGRSQSIDTYPLRFILNYKTLSNTIPISSFTQIPPRKGETHE